MKPLSRDAVTERARRELTDTRWEAVRGRRPRRAVVIAFAVALVVVAVVYVLADAWGLLALPPAAGTVFLLRRAVRTVADLPDEHLDERLIGDRDRAYLNAYRILGCMTLSGLIMAMLVADHHRLGFYDLSGVFWPLCIGAIGLPSAVLAWTSREVG